MTDKTTQYSAAGVDLEAADKVLDSIRGGVRATLNQNVLSGIGSYGGIVRLPKGMTNPVLVSSVDSVGTKVSIASAYGNFSTVGRDLVNHCVNDILCTGATPLLFVDYIAHSDFSPEETASAINGVAAACEDLDIPLVAGETAQLPGVYQAREFDLVGTVVGVLEEENLILGSKVAPEDVVIALPSNGIHTNGLSLARKVFSNYELDFVFPELGRPLGEELLAIHRCYLNELLPFLPSIHGLAHITGGGIWDNIPRILPEETCVTLEWGSWQVPPLFHLIQSLGDISFRELLHVFNMGIGMIVICDRKDADQIIRTIPGASLIGEVQTNTPGARQVTVRR
mgnify:CR=1 FL=1